MNRNKRILPDIGIAVGVLLIAAALIILVFSQMNIKSAAADAKKTADILRSLMPDIENAVPDDRANVIMPAVETEKTSFCGIIEIPQYGCELPVCETWKKNRVRSYPCRYLGSIYDGSLIIGGSDGEGQFDFVKKIQNNDSVFVTDMTGDRYRYTVTDIRRTKDVSTENLTSIRADLVLFAKNSLSLDYTVIRCEIDFSE